MIPSVKKGGTAVVSMQDIADKAGVSRVTVSRVLSNHPSVKAETRQKVLHWVKALDYEPNLIAQSLAGNRTNIIGLLVPEIAYPFFSEIIESIENQAFYEGYSVIICNTHRSLEKEKNILAQLRQRKVDGIIAVPVSADQSLPAYQRLQVPAVMITKKMEGFSSVYISHYNGGQQIARHFLNMDNRIALSDVIECPAPENMNASLVHKLVKQYAQNTGLHCEAYLANDDITACEAIAAFRELGYAVPQDIAIAGFDNSLLAKEISPKLTALAQPLDEIGKKSVEILLSQINDGAEPCMYELESRVIARESTVCLVPAGQ